MSNTSEEEGKVHPMVSNLLGQKFIPRIGGETFRYDRDEMLRLKVSALSTTRPDILSTDFDGEDGKFSPYKWLEHRWEVEGIKNRPPNKKLQDALRAECDENSGLSPQRRGFSGGCRAPEEKKEKEGALKGIDKVSCKDEGWSTVDTREHTRERTQVGSNAKWKTSSSDKFNNGKSNDFKLPFQKSTAGVEKNGRSGSWKTVEGKERQSGSFSATGKFLPARSYRGADDRAEKLPEWADGPTTMDDMIELKGFEEPVKGKKKGAKANEKPAKTDKPNSRPSSRDNASAGPAHDNTLPVPPPGSKERTALPASDAELAAILGLMDLPPGIPAPSKVPEGALSGSRMSRFFNKSQPSSSTGSSEPPVNIGGPGFSGADETTANTMLAKLFSHSSTGNSTPGSTGKPIAPTSSRPVPMRLEDLERNIVPHRHPVAENVPKGPQNEHSKGNPLQDPHQQAHLLQKLHKISRQQEEAATSNGSPPPSMPKLPQQPGFPGAPVGPFQGGMLPPPEQLMHAQAQQLLAMQLQHAYPGGVPPIPPAVLDRMRNDLLRNLIARQQMAATMAHQQAAAAAQHKQSVRAPAMIPSSVQRHMTKVPTTSHAEEKREKERESEEDPAAQNSRNQADVLKKMQMQQQYSALMTAMQNGLPMAALRQPAPPHPQMNQTPTPQQLLMAAQMQAAQQQQIRLAYMQKQQQQAALMKLMALQQQQQMQQQSGGDERPGPNHGSNGNVQSELFQQVGPIQTPLEKLLTAAGVQPSQFTGSSDGHQPPEGSNPMFSGSARPMSLEELERQLTEKSK